jgi:hypothetical protein
MIARNASGVRGPHRLEAFGLLPRLAGEPIAPSHRPIVKGVRGAEQAVHCRVTLRTRRGIAEPPEGQSEIGAVARHEIEKILCERQIAGLRLQQAEPAIEPIRVSPAQVYFDLSIGYQTGDRPANEYLRGVDIQLTVNDILDNLRRSANWRSWVRPSDRLQRAARERFCLRVARQVLIIPRNRQQLLAFDAVENHFCDLPDGSRPSAISGGQFHPVLHPNLFPAPRADLCTQSNKY